MGTREKMWIGSMLLILSIFSVVCFNNANRDFLCMHKTAQHELLNDEPFKIGERDGISCSTEALETRSTINQENDMVWRSNGKNSRSLVLLLFAAVILFAHYNLGTAVKMAHVPILCRKAMVLYYIQNQDGKK